LKKRKGEGTGMKELLIKTRVQRLPKPSLHQMTLVVGLIVCMALLNGCASDAFVQNIKSKSDLKPEEKVLAGRFACFENDAPVHCTRSGFYIFFNKAGEPQSKLFKPDDAGYVYIAVTEGYYYFATLGKEGKAGRDFIADLDPFPVVLVRSEDSVVNFGTLEVRFNEGPGPKGSTAQRGGQGPKLFMGRHIADYDVTRSEIASRIGRLPGSISDAKVESLQRVRR
jgi:hypothetical protein